MWTLESELLAMGRSSEIEEAVENLGLLPTGETLREIQTVSDWHQAGSETFIYRFRILTTAASIAEYLLKAVTAFSPGIEVSELAQEWLSRRLALQKAGVTVPRCHSVLKATFLEEYIPESLATALHEIERRPTLINGCARFAATLDALGFQPVSPFVDVRVRGTLVIPVDFGSDLGPAGLARTGRRLGLDALLSLCKEWATPVEESLLDAYETTLGRLTTD